MRDDLTPDEATMADDKNSEAKLLEISKEAHKLTHMIQSWPKEPNFDGRSEDITRYLMRGAFDLQESLVALRRLQGKSNVKKPHTNAESGEVRFGIVGSRRFERLAMDGSLFHYIDGLKEVVSESNFSQQHPPTVCDNASSLRKSLGFLMSSDLNGHAEKRKGPSLIAKLMGLEEEWPARRDHHTGESSCEPIPILAIEMPKTRKLASMRQTPQPRTKTANEVVRSKDVSVSDVTNANVTSSRAPRLSRRRPQSPSQFIGETVCDDGEMLTRTNRNESKSTNRNKTIQCRMPARLAPAGQEQKSVAKIDHGSRATVNQRKTRESKGSKAITALKSQAKLTSTPPSKFDNKSIAPKGSNASRRYNPTSSLRPRALVFTDTTKVKKVTNAKPVANSMDMKTVTSNATRKGVNKTNGSCNLPVDIPRKTADQSSTTYKRGCKSKESKLFCEPMVKSSKGSRSSRSADVSTSIIRGEANMNEAELQHMFLSSRPFIRHAQELFGLHGYQAIDHQWRGVLERGSGNADLLLDCAKESMARRRHQLELSSHKMMQTCTASQAVGSLDQLVGEICSGIGKLTGHSRDAAVVSIKDGVYVRLGRDLGCRDMMLNAMWDSGWVNWICVEEADNAVGQVEGMILRGLVEELVVELVQE